MKDSDSPRRECRKLVKRGKALAKTLVAPMAHTVAAQIDGLQVQEFLSDATRMAKCLTALHQAIQADAIVCFVDEGLVAEALGALLDRSSYPPEIISKPGHPIPEDVAGLLGKHPQIQVGVDVLKRLGTTITDESLFAVVITGPATLARQIDEDDDAAGLETCGRIVSETGRIFAEAGAHVIMIVEKELPHPGANFEGWRSALVPVINIARFYSALPVLVPVGLDSGQTMQLALEAPENILVCTAGPLQERQTAAQLPDGENFRWAISKDGANFLTTEGEIHPGGSIPELRKACQRSACQAIGNH